MNETERLDLKRMIDEMDSVDNTDNIRKLKHSVAIRNDIRRMENLKTRNASLRTTDIEQFTILCQRECSFLYENYDGIFKKVLNDEIDLAIMTKLLSVLKLIEDGKLDQHEGSVMVGKTLKELYIDSAVKHADNLDKKYAESSTKEEPNGGKTISWREFKKMNVEQAGADMRR